MNELDDKSQAFFDFNQLKPFDKVLVRYSRFSVWRPAFFHSYRPESRYYPFQTINNQGESFTQCVPYEGNEYLMGTTQEASPYYKFE